MIEAILSALARPPSQAQIYADASAWWVGHQAHTASFSLPIDKAIIGALSVDRLGYAFAGGYAAALASMFPEQTKDRLASFAVTEDGGNHPRAIMTTWTPTAEGGLLNGYKRWVTLGPEGGVLLVAARQASEIALERPQLKLIAVDVRAPGVRIEPLPEAPFVPEIPHASLVLDNVALPPSAVLPGDGYDRYVKPFRSVEDLHVFAALLAHLVGVGRRSGFDDPLVERLISAVIAARALAVADASAPSLHLALAGLLGTARSLVEACDPEWLKCDADTQARWQRDRALLGVAGKAREARRQKAWLLLRAG